MAGTILTPSAIWNGFHILETPKAQVIDTKKDGDIVFDRLFIDGRTLKDGKVKIFGVMAKNRQNPIAPAILLIQDFNHGTDERLVKTIAKHGFTVLSIDLAGARENKEFFTEYPEEISYANYNNVKDDLCTVKGDATSTCWYEWTSVAKYAFRYLTELDGVTKVGVFGIGEAATVAWQVAGTEQNLSCAVFALNAGWSGYRGIYKFGGMVEPQFSDNMYKFIAGIEPQAYAMHVKCPTLLLSATNSSKFDCDRAYDTITRISEDVYSAIHYSVGYRDRVSGDAFINAMHFFNEFLVKEKADENLPSEVEIGAEIMDGEISVKVTPQKGEIKNLYLFVAEETVNPAVRCWQRFSKGEKQQDGSYIFTVKPYPLSGMITTFAQAYYKDGTVIGSKIINKKFSEKEVDAAYKSNIIYSSRLADGESVFTAENQNDDNPSSINVTDKKRIKLKKGPMGIEGVTCEWGLLTFKFGTKKDCPKDDAMLMLDCYKKQAGVLTVKLIADYTGARTEYLVNVNLTGGDVWQNVKIELSKFKTAEGMSLKNISKIDAITFGVDGGEYLINNALWV